MLLISMVRLGVSKQQKTRELSSLAVMTILSTSTASRIRKWSERAKCGPMTCMVARLMKRARSNLLPQLSVQRQCTCKLEESPIVPSGNTLQLATTTVMLPFQTTMTFRRESRPFTSRVSGAKSWSTLQIKSSWQLVPMMTQSTSTRSMRKATHFTGPSRSYIHLQSQPWTGRKTRST